MQRGIIVVKEIDRMFRQREGVDMFLQNFISFLSTSILLHLLLLIEEWNRIEQIDIQIGRQIRRQIDRQKKDLNSKQAICLNQKKIVVFVTILHFFFCIFFCFVFSCVFFVLIFFSFNCTVAFFSEFFNLAFYLFMLY